MGRRVRISPQQRVLLEALLAPNPLRPLHIDELQIELHGGKAATKTTNSVYAAIRCMNQQLAGLSVSIVCWRRVGYRIQMDHLADRKAMPEPHP